ncbi:MAG: Hsp70 family protein [Chlamydiales bacterium]|nr:hsp70 family protein [Chlamydiales bacterium]NCF70933.1 Hsp70 family protein [Chlamydiales bacterium]
MLDQTAKYIVGIDLGTTHSACYFFDQSQEHQKPIIQRFSFRQYFSEERLKDLDLLPSFIYLLDESDEQRFVQKLPWEDALKRSLIVGSYAKDQGYKKPSQWVKSAKSWLVHGGVNRKEAILPIEGEGKKISPFDASFYILDYIKRSWNHRFKEDEDSLEQQNIVITVPASFDEVARSLTLEAAKKAGLGNVSLIEEPQAAFYHQLYKMGSKWEQTFSAGERILVCDVGGGTTDFSLIEVKQDESKLYLERSLVGDHLLLGGDNIDLALAYFLKQKIEREKSVTIDHKQFTYLTFQAKQIKERLYQEGSQEMQSVFVEGAGSSLIAGGISYEVKSSCLREFIEEGFFGLYQFEQAKLIEARPSLKTMGLPYEKEASVVKQLAHFLSPLKKDQFSCDYVLFNGGSLKPKVFRERLKQNLEAWFQKDIKVLDDSDLDFSVAKGAAYFALAQEGKGVKIKAGAPRSLYVEVATQESSKWLCICPKGQEFGTDLAIDKRFLLKPNTKVSFRLACSSTLSQHAHGELLDFDEQFMDKLEPMVSFLKYGKSSASDKAIPVELHLELCHTGAILLSIHSKISEHSWKLSFDFSQKNETASSNKAKEVQELLDSKQSQELQEKIKEIFKSISIKDFAFFKEIELFLEKKKQNWSLPLLRLMFDQVAKLIDVHPPKSDLSTERYLNILGFLLRPGEGFALDEQRVKWLWRFLLPKLNLKMKANVEAQKWILIRRISSALSRGQQRQLSSELYKQIYDKKKRRLVIPKREAYLFAEQLRAFASLERAEKTMKENVAQGILEEVFASPKSFLFWSLTRICSRRLMYADLTDVMSTKDAETYLKQLLNKAPDEWKDNINYLMLLKLVSEQVDYEPLNIDGNLFDKVKALIDGNTKLFNSGDPTVDAAKYSSWIAGDELPPGLSIGLESKV